MVRKIQKYIHSGDLQKIFKLIRENECSFFQKLDDFFDDEFKYFLKNPQIVMKNDHTDWLDVIDAFVSNDIKAVKYKVLIGCIYKTMDEIEELFLFDDNKITEDELDILPMLEYASEDMKNYYRNNMRVFLVK